MKSYLNILMGTLLGASMLCPTLVLAEDKVETEMPTTPQASSLKANLRRISLDFSSTNVSNAREYENSPISELSADGQTVIKGVFDFDLEYNHEDMRWNNGLFMEYGKTKLKPADGPSSTNEDNDKILLSSNYAYKMWKYPHFNIGPMTGVEYQTEFTKNDDAPRQQVLRGKGGISVFDGTIIKDLYAALVGEYDMTYSSQKVSKFAGEVGWRIEYDLREGVKLSTDGYYRDYWTYSEYVGTDLRYDLSAKARMDVKLWGNFAFGPYISYRQAQARETSATGRNVGIGVSLSYNDLYTIK